MDLSITNNRTCAVIPGHQLCLDYQLPAIQQIFTKFLEKHPLIPDYKDCRFYNNPHELIECSSASHYVRAEAESKDALQIVLHQNSDNAYQWLNCDINDCYVRGGGISYQFYRYPDTGKCIESFIDVNVHKHVSSYVPCDADVNVALLDECLKHSPITLEKPQPVPPPTASTANTVGTPPPSESASKGETAQPVPPPTAPAAKTMGAPPPSGNGAKGETTQPVAPPNIPNAKTVGTPPSFGNSAPQNPTSFSYLQTGLGAAATIYLAYKAYKERGKMDAESLRNKGVPQLKVRREAASDGSNKRASGWRPLGYVGAAIVSGAFTYYSIRP